MAMVFHRRRIPATFSLFICVDLRNLRAVLPYLPSLLRQGAEEQNALPLDAAPEGDILIAIHGFEIE